MAFKDLLVPKWKHSKAAVRQAAVDTLENNPVLLAEIARTDSAPEVRAAAIRKIEDEGILSSLIEHEKSEEVKQTAIAKRLHLLEKVISTSADPQAVVAALEKFNSEKAIADYLCTHATDPDIQDRLVKRISNPQLLCKLTEHNCSNQTCEQIVETISDKASLQRIAQKASNKKIRLLAQNKIDTLFVDTRAQQNEVTKKLEQCLRSMNQEISTHTFEKDEILLATAQQIWNLYDPTRSHALATQFGAAETKLINRIALHKEKNDALKMLQSLADRAELLAHEQWDVAAPKFDDLQKEWDALDRKELSAQQIDSIVKQFASATIIHKQKSLELEKAQKTVRLHAEELNNCCNELERFIGTAREPDAQTYARIVSRWSRGISQGDVDPAAKLRFANLQKNYEDKVAALSIEKQTTKESEERFTLHLVTRMEEFATRDISRIGGGYHAVVDLKRKWDTIDQLAQEYKKTLEARFTEAYAQCQSLYLEFKEQSSWQQWATENVLTNICTEAEKFETELTQGAPIAQIARKVYVLQDQWKKARRFDRQSTPELISRFETVCSRIFSYGTTKKAELLEELKAVLSSEASQNISDSVKSLQKSWNDIGYLPVENEKQLADEFYTLCNSYFEQRKEQHQNYVLDLQKNLAIREDICKQADALKDSTSWKETIAFFKELQQKWEDAWPAPLKNSRELWTSFNGYREQFFSKYELFKESNVEGKAKLCESAEELLKSMQPEKVDTPKVALEPNEPVHASANDAVPTEGINYSRVFNEVIRLQREWKESGPVAKELGDKLWGRFRTACDQIIAQVNLVQESNRALKEALVIQAEALVDSTEWSATADTFATLREQWRDIEPASRRDEQALWTRLQEAGNKFFERRRLHFAGKKEQLQQQLELSESLCKEMEMLVRFVGKGQLLSTTETTSAAEILKKGIDLRNEIESDDPKKTAENIKKRAFRIIDKWEADEPGTSREYYQLEKKFFAMVEMVRTAVSSR